jgi:hypothetical protein
VKSYQLIIAALVIFLAGMVAGGAVAGLRTKARAQSEKARAERTRRELALSPMGSRLEFLRRVQKEIDLTPEQRTRIEGFVQEAQERFRHLWEPVAPQVRTEFEALRKRIRAELSPAQQERFDQLIKERSRRPEDRERRGAKDTNRPPREANLNSLPSVREVPSGPPK